MKKIYKALFDTFSFLKVASMCLAGFYLIFWFYRFLNFPFADTLAIFFDFFINPIRQNWPTTQFYANRIIEMAYFIGAIFLLIMTFIFARLEDLIIELDRRYDIKDLAVRKIVQEKVNKELQDENTKNLLRYKYFSCYLRFRVDYINEIIAQRSTIALNKSLERAYRNVVSLFKQWSDDGTEADHWGNSVFIRCNNFENFDNVMGHILEAIKVVKSQNSKDAIKTDFMLILDSQTMKTTCDKSYETLVKISDMEAYNKAIVTLQFKVRFDLIAHKSKFMTDVLGFSVIGDKSLRGQELYVLKTKSQSV